VTTDRAKHVYIKSISPTFPTA